jgi:hypothetical protein
MIELQEHNWTWGTSWQLWACRLTHVLGLIAVLAMLWLTGIAR